MGKARWLLAAAGVVGVGFDVLFWGHRPGVSVPLFVGIAVLAVPGAIATRQSVNE